ncbi:MAG: hypothetical protein ACK4M3_07570, partial [Pyrobaculum sp.]
TFSCVRSWRGRLRKGRGLRGGKMTAVEYFILLVMSLVILALFMYIFLRDMSRTQVRQPEVYTLVRCGDGVERKRKYQEGDYVGKPVGECGGGVVVAIFKEVPQHGAV